MDEHWEGCGKFTVCGPAHSLQPSNISTINASCDGHPKCYLAHLDCRAFELWKRDLRFGNALGYAGGAPAPQATGCRRYYLRSLRCATKTECCAVSSITKLGIEYELREYRRRIRNILLLKPWRPRLDYLLSKSSKRWRVLENGMRGDGCDSGGSGARLRHWLRSAGANAKFSLYPWKELQGLTGYIRGEELRRWPRSGKFPVLVDETIELFDVISISGGVRGLQILIKPADYLRATGGLWQRWAEKLS